MNYLSLSEERFTHVREFKTKLIEVDKILRGWVRYSQKSI